MSRKIEKEREREEYGGPSNQSASAVSYHPSTCTCDFFDDWCFVSVTFCQLPLLTSVFWIGLGGSLERPSHSIDLAEMRRYCIMYYQQSYVLILSHEMALFPFTYHLNFNYVNDSLIILRLVRFQGPVLFVFELRALNAEFCLTFANNRYCSVWPNHNPIRTTRILLPYLAYCIYLSQIALMNRFDDMTLQNRILSPLHIRPKTLHVHTAVFSLRYLLRHCRT